MGEWAENATLLLRDSLSFCDSVSYNDISGFEKLKKSLDSLLGLSAIPKALESQVKRTSKLIHRISLGDNDFDKGILKVQESLSRMVKSIPNNEQYVLSDNFVPQSEEKVGQSERQDNTDNQEKYSISNDMEKEITTFNNLVEQFNTQRENATIDLVIKLDEWKSLFSGLELHNLHTATVAVREELLNNPEFHVDTLKKMSLVIGDIFKAISEESVSDVSEEWVSSIFEIEDKFIHEDEANSVRESFVTDDTELPVTQTQEFSSKSESTVGNQLDRPVISADIVKITDENYDLLLQFVDNQSDVLALFEALALNYDESPDEFGDEIKGILHSWKGEFGVLDLQKFCQLCHFLEDEMEKKESFRSETLFRFKDLLTYKFREIKSGAKEILLTDEEIAYLISFKDEQIAEKNAAKAEVAQEAKSVELARFDENATYAMPDDDDLLNGFITESREHLQIADASILELEKSGHNPDLVDSVFRSYHTIKGVASFLNIEPIRFLAHEVENYIDLIRAGKIALDQNSIDITLEGTDILKHGVEQVAASLGETTYTIPSGLNDFLFRLQIAIKSHDSPGEKIKKEIKEKKETAYKEQAQVVQKEQVVHAESVTKRKEEAQGTARKVSSARKANLSETVRVPVDRLDLLIDTIGEAVIAQSMVVADSTISAIKKPELVKKIAQAEQIMRQVQELSMSMRMVSIKPTFQKMARLVRDLSLKFNKDIDFIMEGQDTDIDKSLVENIGDPLIHMVRNALDHGIESSQEERLALEKPAKATVTLRAFHKSGSIYIEIEDDGRGLNKEKILEKAINQGLIKPDQELSENEIFNLIFKPGFSTAQQITDISGRGVGMDVVLRNITDMRGAIQVSSELGVGTTFSIRLPLTLAIIDGMVVSACGEKYIIPKLSIVESLIPTEKNLETVLGNSGKMIKFRGSYLVFRRLEDIFELNSSGEPTPIEDNGVIVVLEDLNGKRVGLFVDEILGQQQVVIKNLGEGMMDIDGVAGGAIMSDGSVNLILDVSSIVSMIE